MLSDADAKLLFVSFLTAVAHLTSVEEKLNVLFQHSLKTPEQQKAERLVWLEARLADVGDKLAKLDANTASARTQLERASTDLTVVRDSIKNSAAVVAAINSSRPS